MPRLIVQHISVQPSQQADPQSQLVPPQPQIAAYAVTGLRT